jgi:hypothetical protein
MYFGSLIVVFSKARHSFRERLRAASPARRSHSEMVTSAARAARS